MQRTLPAAELESLPDGKGGFVGFVSSLPARELILSVLLARVKSTFKAY